MPLALVRKPVIELADKVDDARDCRFNLLDIGIARFYIGDGNAMGAENDKRLATVIASLFRWRRRELNPGLGVLQCRLLRV